MTFSPPDPLRLGYCTNVHPGESLSEILDLLSGPVTRVRESLAGGGTLDLGLWLPHRAAAELAEDTGACERLHEVLEGAGLRVFTLNVFPYGGFHDRRVKEKVYEPSWLEPERAAYTVDAARVLAGLLEPEGRGSLSTLAGADRRCGSSRETCRAMAARLLEVAGALWRIRRETGRTIALALEPEPATTLECAGDCVSFFRNHILGKPAEDLARRFGLVGDEGEQIVRDHLGVCLDTCHHAVMFDEPTAVLERYEEAGIRVAKVQISNALEIVEPHAHPDALDKLWTFDEPRFLHQAVVCHRDGGIRLIRDLSGLRAAALDWKEIRSVRVHFHVPLFADVAAPLATTASSMRATVREVMRRGDCRHFEVETYTWGVLPASLQANLESGGLAEGLARELSYARGLLDDAAPEGQS